MRQLIIISLIAVFSAESIGQEIALDSLVTLSFQEIKLKEALTEISDQFDIRFSYSDSKIPVNDNIYYVFNEVSLKNVLKSMLQENGINYNIIGNQIVLFPFNKNQNIVIRGNVTDHSSGSPVPYANIAIAGTNRGTSTNVEGEFLLSVAKLPSELLISHLSYERKLIYVYDDSKEIEINLHPTHTTLQEITVSAKRSKKSHYHLIKKAYDELSKSKKDMMYGKAFYRQKSSREDRYTEIFEIFYDIKYSFNGIEDWAVQEGRYAFQNEKEYDIFLYNKNFTLLSRLFPLQQPATDSYTIPLNPDVKKLFDLELKNVLNYDERLVAVISYIPKPESPGPISNGELYIDLDTYEVLKMKGTFEDEELEIIGFTDNKSSWENSKLDFQISFIDNYSGDLQMDFIQIDHQFDYYYKDELIGNIETSSLLTFYEHYSPSKNKRLGGAIDYRSSDMEVIDEIGYNPAFWSQNPIVKRTPLEEKLIRDFEDNDAFGVVFLNQEEQVVLLPENQDDQLAKNIISTYESKNKEQHLQRIFIQLDKEQYQLGENLRFTGYVLDRWSLKPDIFGSVLFLEIYDSENILIYKHKFDINDGMSYGEIELAERSTPGKHLLKAYTNADSLNTFEKEIFILKYQAVDFKDTGQLSTGFNQDILVNFYPESGIVLNNTASRMVLKAMTNKGVPVNAYWHLVDKNSAVLQRFETNNLGIGSFEFTPKRDSLLFVKPENGHNLWPVPAGKNNGLSLHIDKPSGKGIQVELYQSPVATQEIYLLSTSGGKVYSFYKKKLAGFKNRIDLPATNLPGGINALVILDKTGNEVAKRSFFLTPQELNIQFRSANWMSKRKVHMEFLISDQNGKAIQAYLSATCSSSRLECTNRCDIRNYLYFEHKRGMDPISLDYENDSIISLINDLLITFDSNELDECLSENLYGSSEDIVYHSLEMLEIEEPVIAEISISSSYSASGITKRKKLSKNNFETGTSNDTHWIPLLELDEQGKGAIEYKVETKNKPIYVTIQGVSTMGQVGSANFQIDPYTIKTKKKSEDK